MANGPIFGIAPVPRSTEQTIQLIAQTARSISSNIQARKQLEIDRQKMAQAAKFQEQNIKAREDNLKLQEERLAFEKEKEQRLVREQESRATARTERSRQADERLKLQKADTKIRLFKALQPDQQKSVLSANNRLMKQAAQFPITTDPQAEPELVEYEGQTASQIARRVSILERSLSGIDEITKEIAPEKFDTLQSQVNAARRALDIRLSQHKELIQSQGHTISSDAVILNNLSNGLESQIANDLGLNIGTGAAPALEAEGKQAIDRAADKNPTPPSFQQQVEQGLQKTQGPGMPKAEVEPMAIQPGPQPGLVAEAFVASADQGGDQVGPRQEFNKLSPQDKMAVFRQVEGSLGTERARAIIFGR